MLRIIRFLLPLVIVVCAFSSCEKSNNNDDTNLTLKVNKWIQEDMELYYRWSAQMPNIDYTKETDPEVFFEKLCYRIEDQWSFITNNAQALLNSFEGKETTFGYSLAFGIFSNTGDVFAVVEYVYPNTPASEAGIKRGDIIIGMNGSALTEKNYTDVIYKSSGTMIMGVYTNQGIAQGGNITMTAKELDLNPVHTAKVITVGGKKIGYLFYTQYISNYDANLIAAFNNFKAQGVSDVVLDLRYNPGGAVTSAINMCSILAPANVVQNESLLMKMQWNDFLQNYWKTQSPSLLQNTFNKNIAANMNLNTVYILTGKGSASASELTITGLDPYMNVVLIGDTTYGKYAASVTLQHEIKQGSQWVVDPELQDWAMQPIVYTYENSQGVTSFKNGFAPDHVIKEDIIRDPGVLGDESEVLLAKAIELITGSSPVARENIQGRRSLPDYKIIDHRFSRFDRFKNTLRDERINPRITK